MNGLERLETEVLEMNDCSISAIFDYLKTRQDLLEKFDNKEKTIKEMQKYMRDRAKKLAKNNVAIVADNLVYMWAVTYFSKSNEELGINKEKVSTPSTKETIKKVEEKEVQEEKPKEENNQISIFEEVQK